MNDPRPRGSSIKGLQALNRPIHIGSRSINPSKATRRMSHLLYTAHRTLARIKKLAERTRMRHENQVIRRQVETLKAAKRIPTLRVREKNQYGSFYLPLIEFQTRNSAFVPGAKTYGTPLAEYRGRKKYAIDYKPVARLNPPRNMATFQEIRRNSFSPSLTIVPKEHYFQTTYWQKCPWPLFGLTAFPNTLQIGGAVGFDDTLAQKALLQCHAKINQASIQMNEYIFEYKQALRLLKDPLKTMVRAHKVLERWTRRDAWIWLPERTVRRFGSGLLVSKQPTGGLLMSMRTRKTIPVSEASDHVLSAAANRWLQYRYGIAPLAMDITTALSWFQGNLEKPWKRSESARHVVSHSSKNSEYTRQTQAFNLIFKATKITGEFYSAKVWYNVKYDPPLSYKLGVHPSQWIQALWNAIPWSFVADWIVNVDDWLSATRTPPWIQIGPNVVTRKVFEKIRARCIKVVPTYCSADAKVTITGEPLAVQNCEIIRRKIDVPFTPNLVLIDRWHTIKNAVTFLALIYKPLMNKR